MVAFSVGLIKHGDQRRIGPREVSLSKDDLSGREMSLPETAWKVKFVWKRRTAAAPAQEYLMRSLAPQHLLLLLETQNTFSRGHKREEKWSTHSLWSSWSYLKEERKLLSHTVTGFVYFSFVVILFCVLSLKVKQSTSNINRWAPFNSSFSTMSAHFLHHCYDGKLKWIILTTFCCTWSEYPPHSTMTVKKRATGLHFSEKN